MINQYHSAILKTTEALDANQIPYYITGSVAGYVHGVQRMTNDVDIVADFPLEKAKPFYSMVEKEFYSDLQMIEKAIKREKSFNIIFLNGMFKIDVFVMPDDDFARSCMSRRKSAILPTEPPLNLFFASIEDTMLSKLLWYKKGGCVSEKQWSDVTDILRINEEFLDNEYLDKMAAEIGVADLLKKAREHGRN